MPRKKIEDKAESRHWKLLLYPDNPVHSAAIDRLLANDVLDYGSENPPPAKWLGIEHYKLDSNGQKIVEGHGKLHWHFAFSMSSEISNHALCARLGLLLDSGEPDLAFVRPVNGRLRDWLLYLTHVKEPDKQQYSRADLRGCAEYLALYDKAFLLYSQKEITTLEAVQAVRLWIKSKDYYITSDMFAEYLCSSPYFRVRNDRLVLSCLYDHNMKIEEIMRTENEKLLSQGYIKRDYINGLAMSTAFICSSPGDCSECLEVDDDDLSSFPELPVF